MIRIAALSLSLSLSLSLFACTEPADPVTEPCSDCHVVTADTRSGPAKILVRWRSCVADDSTIEEQTDLFADAIKCVAPNTTPECWIRVYPIDPTTACMNEGETVMGVPR